MIAHMPETQEELLIKKKRRGRKKEREKDEEVATFQEKKFEANKEMEEVEKAKSPDKRENKRTTENYVVSSKYS